VRGVRRLRPAMLRQQPLWDRLRLLVGQMPALRRSRSALLPRRRLPSRRCVLGGDVSNVRRRESAVLPRRQVPGRRSVQRRDLPGLRRDGSALLRRKHLHRFDERLLVLESGDDVPSLRRAGPTLLRRRRLQCRWLLRRQPVRRRRKPMRKRGHVHGGVLRHVRRPRAAVLQQQLHGGRLHLRFLEHEYVRGVRRDGAALLQ
jgi:hypothetical protein